MCLSKAKEGKGYLCRELIACCKFLLGNFSAQELQICDFNIYCQLRMSIKFKCLLATLQSQFFALSLCVLLTLLTAEFSVFGHLSLTPYFSTLNLS